MQVNIGRKRWNYGKTSTSLIFLKKQWVWWYNKKGEVNEVLKTSKILNCSRSWDVAKQIEIWFTLVVCAVKYITISKKNFDLVKCWDTYTPVRTSYQLEQVWFPRLRQEDDNSVESYVEKLLVDYRNYERWFYMRTRVFIYLLNCVFPNGWILLKKRNFIFIPVKLRVLLQLILFFM